MRSLQTIFIRIHDHRRAGLCSQTITSSRSCHVYGLIAANGICCCLPVIQNPNNQRTLIFRVIFYDLPNFILLRECSLTQYSTLYTFTFCMYSKQYKFQLNKYFFCVWLEQIYCIFFLFEKVSGINWDKIEFGQSFNCSLSGPWRCHRRRILKVRHHNSTHTQHEWWQNLKLGKTIWT